MSMLSIDVKTEGAVSKILQGLFAGKPELIAFDLDGTLVDSVPDLAKAVDDTLSQLGRPPAGESKVRHWVGNGAEMLVRRALAKDGTDEQANKVSETFLANAMTCFFQNYKTCNGEHSTIYPGVLETLKTLKASGIPLALITNKPAQFTDPLLAKLGLDSYFNIVLNGDSLENQKPHPEQLLHAAIRFQANPMNCLMVGDSRSDVEASRASFFKVACVDYGYNHGEPISEYKPDCLLSSVAELIGE